MHRFPSDSVRVWLASRVGNNFYFLFSWRKHGREPISQSQKACYLCLFISFKMIMFQKFFFFSPFVVTYKISVWAQRKVAIITLHSLWIQFCVFPLFIVSSIFTWEPQKLNIRIYVQFINLQSIFIPWRFLWLCSLLHFYRGIITITRRTGESPNWFFCHFTKKKAFFPSVFFLSPRVGWWIWVAHKLRKFREFY